MIKFWEKLNQSNKIDYRMALNIQMIVRRIMFILGYFMVSKFVLNFVSKRLFKSEVEFKWSVFETA